MGTNDEAAGAWSILIVLAVAGGVAYFNDCGSDTIQNYTVMCSSELVNGQCLSNNYYQSIVMSFAVYPEQQNVVMQVDLGPPQKLFKCAVVNKTNWKCHNYADGDSVLGFEDGKYYEGTEVIAGILRKTSLGSMKSVSKWNWWTTDKPPRR